MKVLVIQFDAPLISFGAPSVDQIGVVQSFPALSMLTGLLANAFGWDRREFDRLDSLQERLRYAARIDRRGEALLDYQTVDLSQDWMLPEKTGWTTHGRIAVRGGASGEATHERYRHYRADSVHTVALTIIDDGPPTVDDVASALRQPARPLFLGRKCCLPASPIPLRVVEAMSLMEALAIIPRHERADPGPLPATWWEGDDAHSAVGESHLVTVTDERDFRNQVHVGRRLMREGLVNPPEDTHAQ